MDDVRNVITSFFLTIAGAAFVALLHFGDGTLKSDRLGTPTMVAVGICVGVAVIGFLFVATLARLRRIQLERYVLMNAILDTFLEGSLRHMLPFNAQSIAGAKSSGVGPRSSGSYTWTATLMLPVAVMIYLGGRIAGLFIGHLTTGWANVVAGILAIFSFLLLDRLYFGLSRLVR